jgi:hypothetical protein
MLIGMDIPVAAGPWLVLGVVLGILVPALAALGVLAQRRNRSRPRAVAPAPPPPAGFGEDDLPAFLDFPPGSVGTPRAPTPVGPSGGWAPLGGPATAQPAPAIPRDRSGNTAVLATMAATALLLIGAAAAVATARSTDPADPGREQRTTEAARPGDVSARLTFEGVVLERHAVGVTVAYPRVLVTTTTDRATAEVELMTFNCLRAEAPDDPAVAGCTRAVPEHAELSTPGLRLTADGAGLRVSGRFATVRRPNGSTPVPTGRVYDLTMTAAPADGRPGTGREPATGLRAGAVRATSGAPIAVPRPPTSLHPHHGQRSAPSTRVSSAARRPSPSGSTASSTWSMAACRRAQDRRKARARASGSRASSAGSHRSS